MSFRFGVALNELPHLGFGLLLASTLITLDENDVNSLGDWAALAFAALTAAGLGFVAWRALRARTAIGEAMAQALGGDWRSAIDPDLADGLRRRRPWAHILLAPFRVRRLGVERLANISYGDRGRSNLLDVYRRRSEAPKDAPVLIYFHGGGYFSGRKNREARALIYRLASRGWVCVSANYGLRPGTGFPGHLVDAKRVIAWVREHGPELGADPSTSFVAGSSAGGHLAAFAALTQNEARFQPGFEGADTSVSAAVCLYGYMGNYYGQGDESSPRASVRADAPPFFIAQGDQDSYSPRFVAIARRFARALRGRSSAPVVYAELPGGQHSFDLFRSVRFEAVVDGVEAFAAWVRSRESRPA